jgi:hypothetical protein
MLFVSNDGCIKVASVKPGPYVASELIWFMNLYNIIIRPKVVRLKVNQQIQL